MILKKFLNFWKSEPRDSYKKNSYKKKLCNATEWGGLIKQKYLKPRWLR